MKLKEYGAHKSPPSNAQFEKKRKLYFITSKRFQDAHEMHDISYKHQFLMRSQSKTAALLLLAPLIVRLFVCINTGASEQIIMVFLFWKFHKNLLTLAKFG
jgi:hypothetical protein